MKNFINSHNQKILKVKNLSFKDCSYMNQTKCPFNEHCLSKGIYKATVYCPKGNKEYVRSTRVSFKTKFNQHKHSLNIDKGHLTTLFKFYKAKYSITEIMWFILRKIKVYIPEKKI